MKIELVITVGVVFCAIVLFAFIALISDCDSYRGLNAAIGHVVKLAGC